MKQIKHRAQQFLFLLYFPLHCLIYLFSFVIPRNKKIFLYGSFFGESFSDNSKYLFLISNEKRSDIIHVWISTNREDIKQIRSKGFKAFHKFSLKGVYYEFMAGSHFYTQSVWDTSFFITHNANRVNLWHGIPLKKIGADCYPPTKPSILREAINNRPYIFEAKEMVLVPSKFVYPFFSSAFRVSSSSLLIAPYPRLMLFLMDKTELFTWIRDFETDYVKTILDKANKYENIWTYMPTWRDANPSFITEAIKDWNEFDEIARNNNALLIVKVHFMTKMPEGLESLTNIIFYDSKADFYPILALSDLLITDYSSVFFDYLLMKKPIIFYAFDLEDYKLNSRNMYFDYEEIVFGNIIYSYKELVKLLATSNFKNMTLEVNNERENLLSKMWGAEYLDSNQELFYFNVQKILGASTDNKFD
ncbi:CDP-glycerol glycerophosphotransferase, TagB/SpsB family [Flavobacterium resistens]|uniref:CDP-glycerol glycerophosphotransferase, TagB/SpsB family n=1 Tax=Flavobacterium resistens TaxID=443612 RepID=A0A521DTW8_9FLAO|nr:CDP-glycerol glycerophosphotransferase family protein [Flavobacterium resistens]MRX68167.1 hypothetical protein [Flavobacterium resistens]SMO75169.1 CDP-glycerol glycerophosphotransferase, TagB/SpsB family [Flavobacterium resistens]